MEASPGAFLKTGGDRGSVVAKRTSSTVFAARSLESQPLTKRTIKPRPANPGCLSDRAQSAAPRCLSASLKARFSLFSKPWSCKFTRRKRRLNWLPNPFPNCDFK